MRIGSLSALATVLLLATSLPASTPKLRRGPTSPRMFKAKSSAKPRTSSLSISPERATQIQTALIKAGYMTGSPSGAWDPPTQAAMEKLQGDNGWQTKLVPDSRAIIKLGLGSSASTGAALASSPREESESSGSDAAPVPASNN